MDHTTPDHAPAPDDQPEGIDAGAAHRHDELPSLIGEPAFEPIDPAPAATTGEPAGGIEQSWTPFQESSTQPSVEPVSAATQDADHSPAEPVGIEPRSLDSPGQWHPDPAPDASPIAAPPAAADPYPPDLGAASPYASPPPATAQPTPWSVPTAPAPATPPSARRPLYEYPIYDEPAPAAPSEPKKARRWPMALLALVSGVMGAAILAATLWIAGVFDDTPVPETTPATGTTVIERITEIVSTGGATENTAIAVGRKVVPSIVTVEVGFNGGTEFQAFASGSGVVLSSDGQIITNDHVIEDAQQIRVIFQDGRIYDAELIGTDPLTDLAVLQIDAEDLRAIEVGSTEELQIGETTIAVGNPLGLEGGASLTVGVLSAFNRQVDISADQRLFGMLQTDAPITQGSSGGALVDAQGRLIGITTAIGVSAAGAEGIGFATPVELVTRITDEIIEIGRVRHAFLGVNGESYIEEGADGVMRPGGAVLAGFVGDISAAEDAGLEVGDRIIAVEGRQIRTMQDLINSLRLYRVGQVIEFDVVRDGETLTAEVTLGERPSDL